MYSDKHEPYKECVLTQVAARPDTPDPMTAIFIVGSVKEKGTNVLVL